MYNTKIINIISGKGGTGKTLLSAILADMIGGQGYKVLVIDMDAFVRGLTALLYFQKGKSLQIVDLEKKTVSDYLIAKNQVSENFVPGIERYRSFDVLPSVPSIDVILDINDINPNNKSEAAHIIKKMIASIDSKYDFIFLDNRAGYDELVSASHEYGDISICIEEEDPISKVTSENLIRQLEKESNKRIFRVVNKSRQSKKNISIEYRGNLSYLGNIPFDIEVMNSFGENTFWDDISKSLYKAALSDVWNHLCKLQNIDAYVPVRRVSPFASNSFEDTIGRFSTIERIFLLYGVLLTIGGLTVGFLDFDILNDPLKLASFVTTTIGIMLIIYVVLIKRGLPFSKSN